MFEKIFESVKKKTPLTHMITNYVTVNDCANILLSCGGSPIMADDRDEAAEITSICSALAINIGTLNARTIESMLIAGKKANELGRPVVLDPVGVGASRLRTDTAFRLLEEVNFAVIRGNASEIKTLALGSGTTKGVDADLKDAVGEDNLPEAIDFVGAIARKYGAIVAMTGEIDIVSDGAATYIIRNGHAMMSRVSGTGCMLTGMVAAFCGANPGNMLEAAAAAVALMGVCGETAYAKLEKLDAGTSTYRTLLIDEAGLIDTGKLNEVIRVEVR